jgi:hypothetical protein
MQCIIKCNACQLKATTKTNLPPILSFLRVLDLIKKYLLGEHHQFVARYTTWKGRKVNHQYEFFYIGYETTNIILKKISNIKAKY